MIDAQTLVNKLLEAEPASLKVRETLERHHTERTRIRGGKTVGKFRMPGNWKVGHAIKS